MKRLYKKPFIKVVACRPMSFIAVSTNNGVDYNFVDETGGNGGGSAESGSGQVSTGEDAREFKFIWDE